MFILQIARPCISAGIWRLPSRCHLHRHIYDIMPLLIHHRGHRLEPRLEIEIVSIISVGEHNLTIHLGKHRHDFPKILFRSSDHLLLQIFLPVLRHLQIMKIQRCLQCSGITDAFVKITADDHVEHICGLFLNVVSFFCKFVCHISTSIENNIKKVYIRTDF